MFWIGSRLDKCDLDQLVFCYSTSCSYLQVSRLYVSELGDFSHKYYESGSYILHMRKPQRNCGCFLVLDILILKLPLIGPICEISSR